MHPDRSRCENGVVDFGSSTSSVYSTAWVAVMRKPDRTSTRDFASRVLSVRPGFSIVKWWMDTERRLPQWHHHFHVDCLSPFLWCNLDISSQHLEEESELSSWICFHFSQKQAKPLKCDFARGCNATCCVVGYWDSKVSILLTSFLFFVLFQDTIKRAVGIARQKDCL